MSDYALTKQLWEALFKIASPSTLFEVPREKQAEALRLIAWRAMSSAPAPRSDLDWSNFEGPKRNVEWNPDDQDLIYTALNYRDDDYGDADEDVGQQLVERLLAAWKLVDTSERLTFETSARLLKERDELRAGIKRLSEEEEITEGEAFSLVSLAAKLATAEHDLAAAEGRAKNATSDLQYWRGQYEALATPPSPHVPCPCTTFEQSEECPVGHPSLLCSARGGKGEAPVEKVVALAAEMMKVAEQVDELEDPFAAWESIDLLKSHNDQYRKALKKIAMRADDSLPLYTPGSMVVTAEAALANTEGT